MEDSPDAMGILFTLVGTRGTSHSTSGGFSQKKGTSTSCFKEDAGGKERNSNINNFNGDIKQDGVNLAFVIGDEEGFSQNEIDHLENNSTRLDFLFSVVLT